jgi:hypothetical protein
MPHYTLVLTDETVERIKNINTMFGGSIGGFASSHISDLAELEIEQLVTVRKQIAELADQARASRKRKGRAA